MTSRPEPAEASAGAPASPTASGPQDKAELRSLVRAARRARRRRPGADTDRLVEADRIARAVIGHLDACPAALAAGWNTPGAVVAAFRSTPGEPDTSALLTALADRGARILVPRTRQDLTLDWHDLVTVPTSSGGDLVRPTPERPMRPPSGDAAAEMPATDDVADEGPALGLDAIADITAMILPGIAIDTHGHRLGQGGGCYDRTLPRLRGDTCHAVLLFDDEVVDDVPVEPHDRRIAAVVTPSGGWRDLPSAGAVDGRG